MVVRFPLTQRVPRLLQHTGLMRGIDEGFESESTIGSIAPIETRETPSYVRRKLFPKIRHLGDARFRAGVIGLQVGPGTPDSSDRVVADLDRRAAGQRQDIGDIALRGNPRFTS